MTPEPTPQNPGSEAPTTMRAREGHTRAAATARPLCAITGSGGYVGGCIKGFFEAHRWDVLEFTRRPAPGARAVAFQLGESVDPDALTGVSALVHCAYDFRPRRWAEIEAVNVEGTRRLLDAARAAGVARMSCMSSISAFPGCRSLYGRAKLAIERIALDRGALTIRSGLVYGRRAGGMLGKLVHQVRASQVVPLIGDGRQVQYLVHNEDLSAFIEGFASDKWKNPSSVLTTAHPQPWEFRMLLEAIAAALHKDLTLVPVPWRFIWAGLKTAETLGLRLEFRSDSVVSLIYQNPNPDLSAAAAAGLVCRPFDIGELHL